jgi:phosphoenolpyruvate carboxykinase (ATP)
MATPTTQVAPGGFRVPARRIINNPTQEELRKLALEHTPNMLETARGSLNKVVSIAKARSAPNTYIIASDPSKHSGQTIDPTEAARIAKLQDEYLAKSDVVRIDGFIGNHPDARHPATLWMAVEGANVAAMQQILYFPATDEEKKDFQPLVQVIYTPGLKLEGYDKGRVILVDPDNYVTRVMGTDYFGESKKGGLRMLNAYVYRKGGLMLHSGAKITPIKKSDGSVDRRLFLIMGDSGTGKTTSTFSPQGNEEIGFSESIQDDFLVLYPEGKAYATENGCFAITYNLKEESEPVIYRGAIGPNTWLENVYQDPKGNIDFEKQALSADEVKPLHDQLQHSGVSDADLAAYEKGDKNYHWTKNSRCIIPMTDISTAGDSLNLPPVAAVGILNRNTNIIPAVVLFKTPAQAAAYFMLGETMGTAASGSDAGKAKRSPFTNVFFPLKFDDMCNRYMELAATMPWVFNFMMNTGWVGGDEAAEEKGEALKVKIRHSSAILQGLADGNIEWEDDPDFGYQIAKHIPGVPEELLQPRKFYAANGRMDEYNQIVEKLRTERREYLAKFKDLRKEILDAI